MRTLAKHLRDESIRFHRFTMYLLEAWDMRIPFQQRVGRPAEPKRVAIHFPHRRQRRVIVRVQRVFLVFDVLGVDASYQSS